MAILPVSHWQGLFDGGESSFWTTNAALSTSGDEWDIYDLAYGIDGYAAMWEATGDTTYLDKALTLAENCIATAQPANTVNGGSSQYNDTYLTWVNHSHPGDGDDGREYPLFESYGWRYVLRTLAAMKRGGLDVDPTWSTRFDTILAFTETNIWDKWYSRGTSNLYRNRTHMASHWAFIAMHLKALTSDVTRQGQCQTVMDDIDFDGMANNGGASLRGNMSLLANPADAGAYWWSNVWNDSTLPGQDVDHGNGVLAYLAEAMAYGSYWNGADAVKLIKILSVIEPTSAYIDGTGTDTGWWADGFVKLGRFSDAAQLLIESHGGTTSQGQFRANMALNAAVLSGTQVGSGGAPDPGSVGNVGTQPSDITSLKVWLKADALVLNDLDAVATWADQSGNGNDFTQATSTARPTYRTAQLNGQPGVDFDGGDILLMAANSGLLQNKAGATIIAVLQDDTGPASGGTTNRNAVMVSTTTATSSSRASLGLAESASNAFKWALSGRRVDGDTYTELRSPSASDTSPHVLTGKFDWANALATVVLDGTAVVGPSAWFTAGNTSNTTSDGIAVGAQANSVQFWNGRIFEVMIWDRVLTDTELGLVDSYVQDKYAITVADYLTQTIAGSGIATAEGFGTAVVANAAGPGTQDILPSGIAGAGAFGSATLSVGGVTVAPTGIASGEGIGTPTVTGDKTIAPVGIASNTGFGTAAITTGDVSVSPTGIAGAEAFGTASLDQSVSEVFIEPTGIPMPTDSLGTPVLTVDAAVSVTGIETAELFGAPAITQEIFLASTPYIDVKPAAPEPPFNRVHLRQALTVYVIDGVYTQTRYPPDDLQADRVYIGGYDYEVDAATATELLAQGFTIRTEIR